MSGPRPQEPEHRIEDVEAVIEKRLFVGRVPEDTLEEELSEVFSEFGKITHIQQKAKVAFISFSTWAATHRALLAVDEQMSLRGHREGQTVVASFAERTSKVGRGGGQQFAKGHPNSRVFVGNLPDYATSEEVQRLFEPFGEITGCNLLPAKGRLRCGFVNFDLWGEALDAITELNDSPFANGCDNMTVILAQPRGSKGSGKVDGGSGGPDVKRRRIEDSGSATGWASNAASGVPTARNAEYESLKVAYLVAMDGGSSADICTELHNALLNMRHSRGMGGGRQPERTSRSKTDFEIAKLGLP